MFISNVMKSIDQHLTQKWFQNTNTQKEFEIIYKISASLHSYREVFDNDERVVLSERQLYEITYRNHPRLFHIYYSFCSDCVNTHIRKYVSNALRIYSAKSGS